MLTIIIPSVEMWDETKNEFVYTKPCSISLEHSLVSVSKWESKWNQPFLTKKEKTNAQLIDYIKCMTITQNVSDDVYDRIPKEVLRQINTYIGLPMTATTFSDNKSTEGRNEIVTSELIYYWMISLNIPFECQKWHLNRLLTLIRVCNIKNSSKKKKTNKNELLSRNAQLNAARRKALGSKG